MPTEPAARWPSEGPQVHRLADADEVATVVAEAIGEALGRAIAARGRAVLALSGGSTPAPMYPRLATVHIDWRLVHVVQVDERYAPAGHPDRNWTAIDAALVGPTGATGHPMPVDGEASTADADAYAGLLDRLCGGVIDVVHLGLGADGHTASLVPDDPVLGVVDRDVAITEPYDGRRRMTLTVPAIQRGRTLLWQVSGEGKRSALQDVLAGDPSRPATRVIGGGDARIYADEAALG